jgi:hypothetical protein
MKFKGATLLYTLAGVMITFAAKADGLDYSYVLAQYNHYDFPSASFYQSGYEYRVGFKDELPADFVLTGDYYQGTFRPVNQMFGDVGTDDYSLGLMYRVPLSDRWDLLPSLAYHSDQAGYKSYSSSDITRNGWSYGLGMRGLLTDQLELEAGLSHSAVGGSSNGGYVGLAYDFTSVFSAGFDLNRSSSNGLDTDILDVFVRFNF